MLRHLPKFNYSGLTIVLSNPSRFDHHELLSGTGGYYFNNVCLQPETNRYSCDIRIESDHRPLIKGTKAILLLGDRALHTWTDTTNNLSEQRGAPILTKQGIAAIASYLPQDALDIQAYEKKINPEADGYEEAREELAKKDYIGDKSRSVTARSNWRFWLKVDTKKALEICNRGGTIPTSDYKPAYKIYPHSSEVIQLLSRTKDRDLYIDIETDFETSDMRCFAFCFEPDGGRDVPVYVVPTLDIHYKPAYAELPNIMRALAIGFRDNCVVAHNGAHFDWFLLCHKYHIPLGKRCFDTMVAQHRIYPQVEKSLGHCTSLWTWEPYHKNEGVHTYLTNEQAQALYSYCGKDVWTMVLIKEAQEKHAAQVAGLSESIAQANASIRPYLITSLLGIKYDREELNRQVRENDRLMMQYLRMMSLLCGPNVKPLISNKKCIDYFHTQMGYAPVKRSMKTKKPSLDGASLYKLKLKNKNPVIDILLTYRRIQKETGVLGFTPWKS